MQPLFQLCFEQWRRWLSAMVMLAMFLLSSPAAGASSSGPAPARLPDLPLPSQYGISAAIGQTA